MSVMCEGESSFLFLVPHPNTDWTNFAPFETLLFSPWIVDKLKSLDQFLFENKLYSALCVAELNYLIIFAFVVVCGNLSCLILLAYSGWCLENPADLCLIPPNKKGKTPTHFCPLNRCWWNWHLTFCLHAQTQIWDWLMSSAQQTEKNLPIVRWCKTQSSAAAPDVIRYFNIKISIFWFPAKSKCHSAIMVEVFKLALAVKLEIKWLYRAWG